MVTAKERLRAAARAAVTWIRGWYDSDSVEVLALHAARRLTS